MRTVFVLIGALCLLIVTVAHEAGHWLAIRAKRGSVLQVRIGKGTTLWRGDWGGTRYTLSLLPLGGRIEYEGISSPTAEAVVAVSGAAANLVLALVLLWAGAWIVGPEQMPYRLGAEGPLGYATSTVGVWLWIVPNALADMAARAKPADVEPMLRALVEIIGTRSTGGFIYFAAALSTLWAALNMIPVPGLGTDGWHLVRAVFLTLARRHPEAESLHDD